jgi:membrane-bound lytic murein transglycosylase B
MATKENIIKFLPQHLQIIAASYNIPDDMLEENADLVVLVLESKSISDQKEKQSWFDLYSLMNQEQIDKLRDILTREKEKLAEIEARYQAKQEEIKRRYEETYAS